MAARRAIISAGLMASMALAAIDGTIVATAVPSIVRDLGSFSLFPWVIAGYMLTQAVATPVYGRLADLFGRRPILVLGMSIFLIGSLGAGLAWSMPLLILFRVVQGLGAGGIQSIVQVIAADLYPLAERGKISGLLSSVWGVSALVGPALGGLLSEYASWRWIFLLNLPVGATAVTIIMIWFRESVERRRHRLDLLGTALLSTGVVAVMLGLQSVSLWPVVAGALTLVVFGWWETRAAEPLLPPWIWRDRTLLGSFLGSAVVGMILIGPAVYLPTFAQGVLGAGAIAAGFALAVQSIGWPITVSFSARLYLRVGFRATAAIGLTLIGISSVLFALMTPHSSLLYAGICSFVNGCGLGLLSVSSLVGAQSQVGWERRGVVTGAVVFFRIGGGALGAAILAAVANTSLATSLGGGTSVDQAARALEGSAAPSLGGPDVEIIRQALADAVHHVFLGMGAMVLLGVIAILIMPGRKPLER